MDRRWLPLNALRAFEAAGRHLSFTGAANSLLVSQSAVSRHVINLENQLGVPLFERRPQQLVLTQAGRQLAPIVTKSFDRLSQSLDMIMKERGTVQRSLRVLLPPTFAHQLAVPILRDFRREYPDIGLDIESTAMVGHPERESDLAIIYSEPTVSDYVLDLLWMARLTILCHPDVLARTPGADLPTLLASNDLLHVRLDNKRRHYLWELFARVAGCSGAMVERGLVFDTAQLAAQYALSGDGLALIDPFLFREEISSGRLVQPFDVILDDGYGYYLAIHPDDLGDNAIAFFRSWLISRFVGTSAKTGGQVMEPVSAM